ncbi:MAG TPA: GNAT family N-acetyltransferase [Rudaea sp.]|jgi:predicted N-acyltransferase/multidrug transporter EmrE-like cation transporter
MQAVAATTIEAFDRDEWNRLFPDTIEDWAYYHAIERSGLPGFELLYFGLRERGELRVAVPAFITDYRLDTTLTGPLRRASAALSRVFPRLLVQRLLSLGSPVAEICHLGFAPDCRRTAQARLLDRLFDEVERYAARRRIALLATKDAPADQDALWAEVGAAHGLRRQPSLPTAVLDIRFDSLDGYLATLSRATRRDMRRKLKSAAGLRLEWRSNIDDILDDVMRLYRATMAHAALTFEELTPDFFRLVLSELGQRASCATYWIGERLVAFNLVLNDGVTLLDKFLGMDYAVAREHNLYYVTWLENVRYCIDHKIEHYQAGQGLHREKMRLGSKLLPNWLWYRHRIRLVDKVYSVFEHLFRLDRSDPELAALMPEAASVQASLHRLPARRSNVAAWCAFLACAALSQVAFKYAALQTGAFEFSVQWFVAALGTGWLWVSVASHVGEFLLWMTILSKSNLSSAFATSAVLFIVVMLASWLLFAEPLGWHKVIGSLVILAGIVLLGADDSRPASAGSADALSPT